MTDAFQINFLFTTHAVFRQDVSELQARTGFKGLVGCILYIFDGRVILSGT